MRELLINEIEQIGGGLTDAQLIALVGMAAEALGVLGYQLILHAMKKDQPGSFTSTYVGMPLAGIAAMAIGYESANRLIEKDK